MKNKKIKLVCEAPNHPTTCTHPLQVIQEQKREGIAKEIRKEDVACWGDIDENLLKEDWEKEFEDRVLEEALNKIATVLNGGDAEMVFRTAIRNTMPFLRKERNPQPKAEWEEEFRQKFVKDKLKEEGDSFGWSRQDCGGAEMVIDFIHQALKQAELATIRESDVRYNKRMEEKVREAEQRGIKKMLNSKSFAEARNDARLEERQRVIGILEGMKTNCLGGYDDALSDAIKEIQDIK